MTQRNIFSPTISTKRYKISLQTNPLSLQYFPCGVRAHRKNSLTLPVKQRKTFCLSEPYRGISPEAKRARKALLLKSFVYRSMYGQ